MTIVISSLYFAKCLVQVKVNIEPRATQRAERVVHVALSSHAIEDAGDAFRVGENSERLARERLGSVGRREERIDPGMDIGTPDRRIREADELFSVKGVELLAPGLN
ncbi:MAG: hypothetical protein ACYDC8_05295 [Gammaproteobacteria bacterium]